MINTKALTIRFGHSRFWRVKFVPTNFYDNYHYIYLDRYIQDFFSQRIFHLIGFVYGHSVIKYYTNFIKAEVFIHDFRLEEFFKTFFRFSKKNARKRISFRKRIFRPFFRKIFKFSKLFKFKKKLNFSKITNKFNGFKKYPIKNSHYYGKKNNDFNSARNSNFFLGKSKKFFSKFKQKYNRFAKTRGQNFNKFGRFKRKKRTKVKRSFIFLKAFFAFFNKVKTFIKNIKIYFFKKINFSSFNKKSREGLLGFKKKLFFIFKFLTFFIFVYRRFIRVRFIKPFLSDSYKKFKNNPFFFAKRFSTYKRYFTFSNYSFLPYSKSFMNKHLSKSMLRKFISKSKFYKFNNFSISFSNIKSCSYYSNFFNNFKYKNFKIINSKLFKFKFFLKSFFSNYSFSPFFSHLSTYNNYSDLNSVFLNVVSTRFTRSVFRFQKKFKKQNTFTKIFALNKSKKSLNNLFRFIKKKRKKKIKRAFLPFFPRFKRLSYTYFKFFRFKFFKFVCSILSRNVNVKFLGIPIKLFIRVVPAYRTTVNIFLRYFITRLFYRYILGDVINPIVRTSMKRFRGFTVVANGRFTRAQMASHKQYKRGSVSFSSISIPIDYNQICVPLKYGTCNLKLWIRY